MPQITVEETIVEYDRFPDTCPICHQGIEPRYVAGALTGSYRSIGTYLELVFKCPRRDCSRLFIGRYAAPDLLADARSGVRSTFKFRHAVPFSLKRPEIPQEITKLSPNFVEIYGQAAAAEQHQLSQVAGVGYRKALEFLIKDYCISRHPDKAEDIKGAWLATCIKNYVDDANTKLCAERAAWLGNDETHYVRRWEDKDIGDLKTLIRLTVAWIEHRQLTEKYLTDMP